MQQGFKSQFYTTSGKLLCHMVQFVDMDALSTIHISTVFEPKLNMANSKRVRPHSGERKKLQPNMDLGEDGRVFS